MMAFEEKNGTSGIGQFKRVRYLMAFMTMLTAMVGNCAKPLLSVAIVAMTNNSTDSKADTYDWDPQTQGTVLSSLFWGYAAFTFVSSLLIAKFGTRNVTIISYLINSIITACLPFIAPYGWEVFCVVRVLQGMCVCCSFPSFSAIMAEWAVPKDMPLMMSITHLGLPIGGLMTNALGGVLSYNWGWPSVFYVFSAISLLVVVLWFFLGYDSPSRHPFITMEERLYIESFTKKKLCSRSTQTPWRSIFTSIPAYALFFTRFANQWEVGLMTYSMPTYMNDVLHYNIRDNGLLMALPFLAQIGMTLVFGAAASFIQQKKIISPRYSQYLFNSIAFLVPAAATVGLIFMDTDTKALAVGLMVISSAVSPAISAGINLSLVEIAPKYASVIMGIAGTFEQIATISVPFAVGGIVNIKGTVEQWQIVFIMTAAVDVAGAVVYVVFTKAETQPWNFL